MKDQSADPQNLQAWCFPAWARAAGVIVFVFGLLDCFSISPQTRMPIGFLLMFAGMLVCRAHLETAKQHGVSWLPMSFQLWGWFNIFLFFFATFMLPGLIRRGLIDYSVLSPLWMVFGIWLTWHAHKVINAFRGLENDLDQRFNNAKALFRFSLLCTLFYLLVAEIPMFNMEPVPGQTVTFYPMMSEYMTQSSDGSASGVLGLARVQNKLDVSTNRDFMLGLKLFYWFLMQFVLIPVFWFISGKSRPWLLSIYSAANAMVLVALPLQFSLQYNFTAFGANGFIQIGYWILWVPVLLQFASLPGFFATNTGSSIKLSSPATHKELPVIAHPRRSILACAGIVVVLTLFMPYLKRPALVSLIMASQAGRIEHFAYYLEKVKRQNPENPIEKALNQAIEKNQFKLVEWLLTQKPDLNKSDGPRGYPPLWWALRGSGNFAVTEMLLKAGANPNLPLYIFNGENSIGFILSGHYSKEDTIRYLQLIARYGANFKAPVNMAGEYPVEFALRNSYRNYNVLPTLIELGAEPLKTAKENLFYLAMQAEKPEIMQTLIDAGMTEQLRDSEGNTFLHILAEKRDFDRNNLARYKVEPYMPKVINAKNNAGKTPLHLAVEKKHRDAVETLLELGADQYMPDSSGVTPRGFAEKQPIIPILKLMDRFTNQAKPSASSVTPPVKPVPDPNQ